MIITKSHVFEAMKHLEKTNHEVTSLRIHPRTKLDIPTDDALPPEYQEALSLRKSWWMPKGAIRAVARCGAWAEVNSQLGAGTGLRLSVTCQGEACRGIDWRRLVDREEEIRAKQPWIFPHRSFR